MSSPATALVSGRRAGLRAALLGAALAAAVLLRAGAGGADPAASLAATVLFTVSLAALALAAGERPGRPAAKALALGAAGGVLLVAGSLLSRPVVGLHPYGPLPMLAGWTLLVGLVAVAEEAVLRGALFGALQEWRGPVAALLLTSGAFALMHLPLYGVAAMPLDLAVGLWLGALRLLSGGWAAPAAAHVLADLAAGWLG